MLPSCFLCSTWVVWRCSSRCERWTSTPELRSPGEILHTPFHSLNLVCVCVLLHVLFWDPGVSVEPFVSMAKTPHNCASGKVRGLMTCCCNTYVVNVSGRRSLWCARPCPEPKEPSAGERYTACTQAHSLTGHYLFIWLKWEGFSR